MVVIKVATKVEMTVASRDRTVSRSVEMTDESMVALKAAKKVEMKVVLKDTMTVA